MCPLEEFGPLSACDQSGKFGKASDRVKAKDLHLQRIPGESMAGYPLNGVHNEGYSRLCVLTKKAHEDTEGDLAVCHHQN